MTFQIITFSAATCFSVNSLDFPQKFTRFEKNLLDVKFLH